MPFHWTILPGIALGAALLSAPGAVRGQPYDLDRDIAEYEDTLKKIRDEKWVYLLTVDAGMLISPAQLGEAYGNMVFTGQMHPDSVRSTVERHLVATRVLRETIEEVLEDLYRKRRERDAGPVPPSPPTLPTVPDRARGVLSGNWMVPCVVDGEAWDDAGTFTLTFTGDGNVSGNYTSGSGGFGVGGSVDPAGNAQGTGSHPDGGFTWMAKMTVADGRPVMQHGSVHFSPNAQSVSCGAGLLTATGSAVLP